MSDFTSFHDVRFPVAISFGATGGPERRNEIEEFHDNFYRVLLRYGFAESPNVFKDLCAALAEKGIEPERPPYHVREGGSRICFVRDPDSYRVELIERG